MGAWLGACRLTASLVPRPAPWHAVGCEHPFHALARRVVTVQAKYGEQSKYFDLTVSRGFLSTLAARSTSRTATTSIKDHWRWLGG